MSRKHRAAHPVYLNALQRAMEGSRLLPKTDRLALKAIVDQAFLNLRRGQNCVDEWRNIADALNTGEVLSQIGICSDAASRACIASGLEVLGAVFDRQQATGSWTLHAQEIKDMDEAIWMHGVQLEHCSLREYEQAKHTVAERTRQALAGNASPETTVVEMKCKPNKRQ